MVSHKELRLRFTGSGQAIQSEKVTPDYNAHIEDFNRANHGTSLFFVVLFFASYLKSQATISNLINARVSSEQRIPHESVTSERFSDSQIVLFSHHCSTVNFSSLIIWRGCLLFYERGFLLFEEVFLFLISLETASSPWNLRAWFGFRRQSANSSDVQLVSNHSS